MSLWQAGLVITRSESRRRISKVCVANSSYFHSKTSRRIAWGSNKTGSNFKASTDDASEATGDTRSSRSRPFFQLLAWIPVALFVTGNVATIANVRGSSMSVRYT